MTSQYISRVFIFISAILFSFAFFVRIISPQWDIAGLFFLIASLVCLSVAVAFDWRCFVAFFLLKTTRNSMSTGFIILIFTAILVALNYGMTRYPVKWDLSLGKEHTLSEISRRVVGSFEKPVTFSFLYMPDPSTRSVEEKITMAVKKYQDESYQVKFKSINILNHPEVTKDYHLNEQEQALFVEFDGRKERFYKTDENSMTQALLRIRKGKKTIYFSTGNKEASIGRTTGKGLSGLKSELERLFYEAREVDLKTENIPKDASAFVLIGPESQLSQKMWDKVMVYFHSGGRLFIAMDPLSEVGNFKYLSDFGLKMQAGTLHMEEKALTTAGTHMIVGLADKVKHPVTKGFNEKSVLLFYVTSGLEFVDNKDVTVQPVIVSPEFVSLREGFLISDKKIKNGPFPLMVHVKSNKEPGGEAFVTADSDVFANQFLYQYMNPALMFNVFSYLARDEELIPKEGEAEISQDFLVTDTQYRIYLASFIMPLPLFFFFLGGFLWFRRRWL